MFSSDKKIQNVADAVSKIMNEKLHPNQQKLDVHEPEKDKLTADDFKKLRAGKKAPEVKKEEAEQIDELSKNTLGSYIKKANYAGGMADFKHGRIADKRGDSKEKTSLAATSTKRQKGISTAVNKLSKEEVEQIEERHMTDDEMAKREKIVKSMKKGMAGFKDRYGDRAKNVMYATANKQAMKD